MVNTVEMVEISSPKLAQRRQYSLIHIDKKTPYRQNITRVISTQRCLGMISEFPILNENLTNALNTRSYNQKNWPLISKISSSNIRHLTGLERVFIYQNQSEPFYGISLVGSGCRSGLWNGWFGGLHCSVNIHARCPPINHHH